MSGFPMRVLRLGAVIVFLTCVFHGSPAFSQAKNFTCSVETQAAESVLTCLNENGTPARLQPVMRNNINLEFGLTLLGSAVPVIDGDLSDADDAIACVQDIFGLTPGPLSPLDAHRITGVGGVVDNRKDAFRYMATRGYRPAGARISKTEIPELVDRVPLNFPEVEEPPSGKRSMINQSRFFDFVYDARISFEREDQD